MYLVIKETARKKVVNQEEAIFRLPTNKLKQLMRDQVFNKYYSAQFLKRWEYETTWPASWEICMQVKKKQLELDMEQQTVSK